MIDFVNGILHSKQPHRVVIDQRGIGLEILVPFSTSRQLPEKGLQVNLLCHLHWREEGPQLFGFASEDERQLFRVLNRVNKVGPKLALNIMSATTPEALASMILSEDQARLTSLKGVGPKLASRLIVELKETIAKLGIGTVTPATEKETGSGIPFEADVREALENLGYTGKEITQCFKKLGRDFAPDATIEDIIEKVLRAFS
ncbi:MAG TPA: Holliday junction branch migration protein RuvA [Candidatus Rifleibacterium sp.]|mgnify:CR=1 FL=1|nr:Holliday junction branch migration protein RuvA [Candidatus Rifleibacterium sp.]HOI92369.1 Holliday junction branch migration protein RuvA [Candidatus Rifleibacterium sp.]HPW59860.1 Holliday junction branch migration protein RuvA [Candidatus Rifleibacterium sp.]